MMGTMSLFIIFQSVTYHNLHPFEDATSKHTMSVVARTPSGQGLLRATCAENITRGLSVSPHVINVPNSKRGAHFLTIFGENGDAIRFKDSFGKSMHARGFPEMRFVTDLIWGNLTHPIDLQYSYPRIDAPMLTLTTIFLSLLFSVILWKV